MRLPPFLFQPTAQRRRKSMSTKVKSAAEIAAKWGRVTPGRATEYGAETPASAADWETKTLASKAAFQGAVTAGNIAEMFAGGVRKAGAAKFARKVTEVGINRFGQGVTAAIADMQTGMDPMVATIASVTPPARQPRGSAANLQRVSAYADALHAKRLALRAAGK
jgi:hypothetical protein